MAKFSSLQPRVDNECINTGRYYATNRMKLLCCIIQVQLLLCNIIFHASLCLPSSRSEEGHTIAGGSSVAWGRFQVSLFV